MREKYVRLEKVENLLSLIKTRDIYFDWSKSYEEYDEKVKEAIEDIRETAYELEVK